MNRQIKLSLFLVRIAVGWYFFYAGFSKILNPEWTSAGFLNNAKTLNGLYSWFALPQNIWWVDLLNEWGLILIGIALILGVLTRWASWAGILLMLLYYLPVLDFPYVGHGYVVDDHIIFIILFALLIASHAGNFYDLDGWLAKNGYLKRRFKD
ncbi:MAG: hypothetical protein COV07_02095 [Candidatus Vogelbacteria bacterium CG10_big_fil_rev_8_21_14_0_10_45_14]|uniref:DoxX subfamily n=1 Tax=Candidatus Vogelbacteria bacterium CG10_big_fil_rev_8_21_14_0_10_45_14 TaxID=1975042 RepID=A0A2H0RLE5_9BACT|nr:MAG: hypothetical protein COV07_02095 [Candidatus Vogelbacteria bacterium CG10_big_fil_rev_8_21_14_0_10_45_14]